MSSTTFERSEADWEAIDAALDSLAALGTDAMSGPEQMCYLQRIANVQRRLPSLQHGSINWLVEHGSVEELGGSLRNALADNLRVTRGEASRRIAEAADLGPRQSLTGQPLPPRLEATAAGQAGGAIGVEAAGIIRKTLGRLPHWLAESARVKAEQDLAAVACGFRPDEVGKFAKHLEEVLNPDGTFSDADRARRRGIHVGPQGADGMSRIWGYLTPAARAGWDAASAKWAAPGMCNPADTEPVVEGTPEEKTAITDPRSAAQRNHDALAMIVRSALMSDELGSHQGLPVTIVATATLEDLETKTGVARTANGTTLPITDVIRMSSHAYHYLLLFDKARRCRLYRGRSTRLATAAQRLVLTATEYGCTRPGCTVPAAWTQVHHCTDWAHGGATDIDNLTLSCGPDNRLANQPGWITRKRKDGTTEWIPPPHLDHGQPRTNTYWHPEKMLEKDDESDDDEDEGRQSA